MNSALRLLALAGAALFSVSAAAEQTNAPAAKASSVTVETFAKGLEHPWGLQFLPDGRLLVTERPGRMRLVAKDGKLSEPLAGVPKVVADGQGGLLDVALAPDFASRGQIFFSYAEPRDGGKNGTSVARAKLVIEGEEGRLEDVAVIFRQEPAWKSNYHFGSRIVFDGEGIIFRDDGRAQLCTRRGAERLQPSRQGDPHHSRRSASRRKSEA